MNEILQEIKKPVWWVSVVAVGLILNVLSSYLRDGIDRGAKRFFGWTRSVNARARERFERNVEGLKGDPTKRILYAIKAVEIRQQFQLRSLWGTIFIGSGTFLMVEHVRWFAIVLFAFGG